jgi:hypothetical protein
MKTEREILEPLGEPDASVELPDLVAHRYVERAIAPISGSMRLLEILANDPRPLAEMLADVPRTFTTPEIRVDCPDALPKLA